MEFIPLNRFIKSLISEGSYLCMFLVFGLSGSPKGAFLLMARGQ
jgi:hypothetical protein